MKISVIIPMYNEEKIIKETAIELHRYMNDRFGAGNFEVLFSNDGSKDNSKSAVNELLLDGIRVVGYDVNKGKGCAVRTATLEAQGDVVMFTDADLAYGVDVIGRAYDHFLTNKDTKMLIGSRNIDADGYAEYTFIRKLMSKIYIRVLCLVGGFKLSDSQCGCKAFENKTAKEIFSRCEINGFSFDFEVIMIAQKLGIKIKEFPVKIINHRESKINIFSDTFKMLSDIRKIKKRVKKLSI